MRQSRRQVSHARSNVASLRPDHEWFGRRDGRARPRPVPGRTCGYGGCVGARGERAVARIARRRLRRRSGDEHPAAGRERPRERDGPREVRDDDGPTGRQLGPARQLREAALRLSGADRLEPAPVLGRRVLRCSARRHRPHRVMDVLRHYGEGTLASFLGGSCEFEQMDHDQLLLSPYTKAQAIAQVNALPEEYGAQGRLEKSVTYHFVDGINAYITATQTIGSIFGRGGNEIADAHLLQYPRHKPGRVPGRRRSPSSRTRATRLPRRRPTSASPTRSRAGSIRPRPRCRITTPRSVAGLPTRRATAT